MNKKKNERKSPPRVVLVGTYKGGQQEKWRGWYCWPLGKDDLKCCQCENVANGQSQLPKQSMEKLATGNNGNDNTSTMATLSAVSELWLFCGTKDERRYKAEFVGIKTREELIRDYGYLSWEQGGLSTKNAKVGRDDHIAPKNRTPKPHGTHYALFKTTLLYRHKGEVPGDAERVIIRTKDFARSPKVRKQLKAYLESPDRHDPDLAKRLPEIITRLRPEQLRVCEAAVQMDFFSWENLQPVHLPKHGMFTAVELFAGAGGLSIGLERAGIHVVIANEIMPDFAATLAATHPDTNVINEDRFWEAA